MKKITFYIFLIVFANCSCQPAEESIPHSTKQTVVSTTDKTLKNGDIIFQTSTSSQSKAIQLATQSPYSHMGIIYKQGTDYFVYEAVEPVKLTPLQAWIKRGKQGHYIVKRLKNAEEVLNSEVLKKMKELANQYKGKHYDAFFEWSDEKLYCSELVWKLYQKTTGIELGQLAELKDFDLSHPTVQKKIQERFKGKIPLHEKVISPAAIFHAKQLKTILIHPQ